MSIISSELFLNKPISSPENPIIIIKYFLVAHQNSKNLLDFSIFRYNVIIDTFSCAGYSLAFHLSMSPTYVVGKKDKKCNFINLALWLSEGGTARYKCSGTVILNHGLKEERISESNEQFKGKETQ